MNEHNYKLASSVFLSFVYGCVFVPVSDFLPTVNKDVRKSVYTLWSPTMVQFASTSLIISFV